MSEPNGEPSPAPNPPEDKPGAGGTPSNNLARAPRANPPNAHSSKEPPVAVAPPGMSEFMAWMKAMGGQTAVEPEPPAGTRGLIPKEQKKFSRRTGEPAKPASSPAAAPEAKAETPAPVGSPEKEPPAAPISVPTDFLNIERKRRGKDNAQMDPGLRVLTQALVVALIAGSFFVGRATVPKAAPQALAAVGAPIVSKDKNTTGLLPDELLAKVDEALAAENAGDGKHGVELLQAVQDSGAHLPGLTYQLALANYSTGEFVRVLPLLNQSIAEGEEIAACYNLRGTLVNRRNGVDKGLADLELAANLDPFNARYAYFLGEALRRAGKPQAALVVLRKALNRLREPTLEGIYELKVRLAQLELDRQGEFATELAAQLAMNPPALDWVLTAAAVEMHRNDMAAAANYLEKAHALVPEPELLVRLRDFYFYTFANRKELAKFYAPINAPPLPAATPSAPLGTPEAAALTALGQDRPTPAPSPTGQPKTP